MAPIEAKGPSEAKASAPRGRKIAKLVWVYTDYKRWKSFRRICCKRGLQCKRPGATGAVGLMDLSDKPLGGGVEVVEVSGQQEDFDDLLYRPCVQRWENCISCGFVPSRGQGQTRKPGSHNQFRHK